MAEVIHWHGDPENLIADKHSGLLDYFFGKERTKSIGKDFILQFQERLINDVLWLEFTRYDPKGIAISDEDFCNHLLLCANFTNKKKKQMVSRYFTFESSNTMNFIISILLYTTLLHML